jgi:hypothetical protein
LYARDWNLGGSSVLKTVLGVTKTVVFKTRRPKITKGNEGRHREGRRLGAENPPKVQGQQEGEEPAKETKKECQENQKDR